MALRRDLGMAAAPPQGSGADGPESGSDSPFSEQSLDDDDALAFATAHGIGGLIFYAGLAITLTLRWYISGPFVPVFFRELFIQELVGKLNNGLIPGIPPSHAAGDGATYVLFWGATELKWEDGDYRMFDKDYGVPDGAELTLVLRQL